MAIDEVQLTRFIDRFAGDLGAALHATTVVIGDKLGLYRTLAQLGPTDAATLAESAHCDARLVQEWLDAQFVSGYCCFSGRTSTYWLTPEQAAVLADVDGPSPLAGSMALAVAAAKDEPRIRDAFRSSAGLAWQARDDDLFDGIERLFRPAYAADLAQRWIPALDGVAAKLDRGAVVADVACGHGAAAVLIAQAFPRSVVVGFDAHEASIATARKRAAESGVADRVRFEVARADDFSGAGYDLVCILDALHAMGDPAGVAAHVRYALAGDGTWLLVEPMAGDGVLDNADPIGRIFYSTSTLVSTPAAQAQPGGCALGAQAPDAALATIAREAGFRRFRRAAETPLHRIFEARP